MILVKIELFHGDDRSAVIAGGAVIEYRRKIHRYESERDYALIVTEQATYGTAGAQVVIDYLMTRRCATRDEAVADTCAATIGD